MKIDTDLRAAIRSAALAQKSLRLNSGNSQRDAEEKAIASLLKRCPAKRAALQSSERVIAECKKRIEEAQAVQSRMGLSHAYYSTGSKYRIEDNKRFVAAGGRYEYKEPTRWTFDQVMAELSAAAPKEGAKIIARIGIKWE